VKSGAFSPEWLARRLAASLPGYPDVSLCVALSGGMDSVTLLAALATHWRRRLRKRTRLRAVHVHHGLHANADEWSEHCTTIAARFGVPLTTLRVKVSRPRGSSLEAAARDARYAALADELARDEVLLTAHHEDDQLETVLLQLMRGAGVAGLAAMPEVTPFAPGTLARPLLTRSHAELEDWARSNDLHWVDDDTNANEQLDRNYLRRRVLPLIRARWPSAARSVSRSARHAAEAQRLLDELALADVERAADGPALSVRTLRTLTPDRRRNAVRFWIARAGRPLPDTTRLDEITRTLLAARPDSNPRVEWSGVHVQRHADLLTLGMGRTRASSARTHERGASSSARAGADATGATGHGAEGTPWHWHVASRLQLSSGRGCLTIEPDAHGPIDLDVLPEVLVVRERRGGERLRPRPGGRTRTLKALLQEGGVPLAERGRWPLTFAHDRLVAVADRWIDASVQAVPGARRRGRIRWRRIRLRRPRAR
jgi:tRNA(Ile)-lysidine synthase